MYIVYVYLVPSGAFTACVAIFENFLVGVDPGFGPNPKNPGNSKNSEPE